MKKIIQLMACMLLISTMTFAHVVKFQVDMTGKTISPNGVHIAGDFQAAAGFPANWNPATTPLINRGNGIYDVTVNIPSGNYQYKFINGNAWNPGGQDESVPSACAQGGNRFVNITAATTIPVVCFGQCAACPTQTYSVTFKVDMSTQTVGPNGVNLAGNFQGWNSTATPMSNQGSGIWAVTVPNIAGNIEYKFVNGSTGWESVPGTCAQNGNRFATINATTTQPTVCFAQCAACPAQTYSVTFKVDMTGKTVSPNGVHLAGSFQNWDPAATIMTNQGNGIWSKTVSGLSGAIEYKFINGMTWADEEVIPAGAACLLPTTSNRFTTVNATTTLPTVCFADCAACVPQTYAVTFQVDMTGQTVSPNGVHLAGNFQGWLPNTTPMTNQGNGIWSVTVPNLGGNIQYKFINNNSWMPLGSDETVPVACAIPMGGNRFTTVTATTTLPLVCYGQCVACPPTYAVTFKVDMTGKTISPAGVHLAGSFQNWDPAATLMTPEGNGIYAVTVPKVPAGVIEYKFINGDNWTNMLEETVPAACAQNTNRFTTISAASTLPTVCFGECTACAIIASISVKNVTCYAGNNGEATVSISGGSGCTPSYLWSNGQTTTTATNLSAGNHSVSISCGLLNSSAATTVSQPTEIVLSNPTTTSLTCIANGTATILANGGTGALAYLWSNNATAPIISANLAGTYSVTVTDANACTKKADLVIADNKKAPNVQITNSNTALSCKVPTIVLNCLATGTNLKYEWTGTNVISGGNTANATIGAGGFYNVLVTDLDNGCNNSSPINATQDFVKPSFSVTGDTAICSIDTTVLSVSDVFPSFVWSNGATTQSIKIATIGNYTVTVTAANGCTKAITKSVIASPQPVVNIATPDSLKCNTPSINLNATSSIQLASAVWSGQNNYKADSLNAKITQSGTYNLLAISQEGCRQNFSTQVFSKTKIENVTITEKGAICTGQKDTLTATPNLGNYIWSNGSTTNSTIANQAGVYFVTITNGSGCQVIVDYTVLATSDPVVTAGNDLKICEGVDATLKATSSDATDFLWLNNGIFNAAGATTTIAKIKAGEAGNYYVVAKNAAGCLAADTVNVSVSPFMAIAFATTLDCDNKAVLSSTVTGGIPAYSYLWTNGSTTQNVTEIKAPATVTLTITDSYACNVVNSVSITPTPPMSFGASVKNITDASAGSIILSVFGGTAPYIYAWSNAASTKDLLDLTTVGTYCVTVTDANGCKKTTCFDIKSTISTLDKTLDNAIAIFPNPTSDLINIQLNIAVELSNIQLLDYTGKLMATYKGDTRQINVGALRDGIYFIKCSTKESAVLKKIIVLK